MNRRTLIATLGSTILSSPLSTRTNIDPTYHYLNILFKDYQIKKYGPFKHSKQIYQAKYKDTTQEAILRYKHHPAIKQNHNSKLKSYVHVDTNNPPKSCVFIKEVTSHQQGHQILSDIRTKGLEYAHNTYTESKFK